MFHTSCCEVDNIAIYYCYIIFFVGVTETTNSSMASETVAIVVAVFIIPIILLGLILVVFVIILKGKSLLRRKDLFTNGNQDRQQSLWYVSS